MIFIFLGRTVRSFFTLFSYSVFWWNCPLNFWLHESLMSQLMGTFKTCDYKYQDLNLNIFYLCKYDCRSKMILLEFDIVISKYSNFGSRQFQSISAQVHRLGFATLATVWGLRLIQNYDIGILLCNFLAKPVPGLDPKNQPKKLAVLTVYKT